MQADPTAATPEGLEITEAAASLGLPPEITVESLARWVPEQPSRARVLGLAVGLSQEKPEDALKHHLGTTGRLTHARDRAGDLVAMLDGNDGLIRLIGVQRNRIYGSGGILVARAGTRHAVNAGAASGRKREDGIGDRGHRETTRPAIPDSHPVH